LVSILFCSDLDAPEPWQQAIARAFPHMGFRIWPDVGARDEIRYALAWRQQPGSLAGLPNLRAILVMGAGVDGVLRDPELPAGVPVLRLLDAGMAVPMAEYALHGLLHFHRRMPDYLAQRSEAKWQPLPWSLAAEWPVGVLGLGVIGSVIAQRIAAMGYPVAAWVGHERASDDIEIFAGRDRFADFLARSRVIINVLPLTAQTENILDARAFAAMPRGGYVINIGRGAHVNDADLIAALDSGQLDGAMLDVFRDEPLPPAHAFWRHPKIIVTPHVAAPTIVDTAEQQVIANIERLERGEMPIGVVSRERGY
jgi:glyoxylate/hydroxypyruvate reductase A